VKIIGSIAIAAAALSGFGASALAQPYPPGAWGDPYLSPVGPNYGPSYGARDPREGKVEAAAFVASSSNADRLGHGAIALTGARSATGPDEGAFEVALVDQLTRAGYQTGVAGSAGQTIEFVVTHAVIRPPEPPHSPVGGSVAVGAGIHGWGGVGLGLNINLSKPAKALIATRLEARIRDSATRELLWEGRAQVATRDQDKRWTPQTIAARLSAALFKGFPKPS
jgi:hypothetical protein